MQSATPDVGLFKGLLQRGEDDGIDCGGAVWVVGDRVGLMVSCVVR